MGDSAQKTPVVFLLARGTEDYGAADVRGTQMSEALNVAAGGSFSTVAIVRRIWPHVPFSGKLVIVNKWAMKRLPESTWRSLASRNRVILDPVDGKISMLASRYSHGILSPTNDAVGGLALEFPSHSVDFIPHHVNTRLPQLQAQQNDFRVAYFGNLKNLMHQRELRKRAQVDVFGTDTSKRPNASWVNRLGEYSAHIAIRSAQSRDGIKPFYKGAFAARFGSVFITSRDESDVQFFLGPDYPFLAATNNLGDVLQALKYAESAFGEPAWHAAVDRMQHVKSLTSFGAVGRRALALFKHYVANL